MGLYKQIERWCGEGMSAKDDGAHAFHILDPKITPEANMRSVVWMDAEHVIGITHKDNLNAQYYLDSRPLRWDDFLAVNAKHMLMGRWHYSSDNLRRLKRILSNMHCLKYDVTIRFPTVSVPLLVEVPGEPMVIFVSQRIGTLSSEKQKILEVGFSDE